MKAWICNTDYSEDSAIVFADTRAKAKIEAMRMLDEVEYIDIRARRCKEIDNMENCEPKDNYWLNDDIRLILVKEHDWACTEPQYSDCDKCVARQHCHYFD